MRNNLPPHRPARIFALPPRWRWLTYSVLAVGGGGTTVALLIQEEVSILELLGLVAAIPLLGAPLVRFVHVLFNATTLPLDR